MDLMNATTVAVADGEKLHMYRNQGTGSETKLIALPEPDLSSDNSGSGANHQSSSANPDRNRLGEDDHAAAVAGYLNRQALEGKIDHLFLIADPRTLGAMRPDFHKALEAKLVGHLAKSLVSHSIADIEAAIAKA